MRKFTRYFLILSISLSLSSCIFKKPPVNRDPSRTLRTVDSVDLESYLGVWHEVARYENSFQDPGEDKHCLNTTAEYTRTKNPHIIAVTNSCVMNTTTGEKSVAKGSAKILDHQTNAKLGVKFFWLAPRADYWILALGSNYEYSLVGEPEGRYLWILSRSPQLSQDLLDEVLEKARQLGYDTSALRFDAARLPDSAVF